MTEPDNLVLVLLRELREQLAKQEAAHDELLRRHESLRQMVLGESVLGRYAAADVEGQLEALRGRLRALDGKD